MKSKANIMTSSKFFVITCAIVNCFLLVVATQAARTQKRVHFGLVAVTTKSRFDTPKQAADALVQVARISMLPPRRRFWDPIARILSVLRRSGAENHTTAFANKAKEKNSIEIDKKSRTAPFSWWATTTSTFPLEIFVKRKGEWSFDTKLNRRIRH